MLLAVDPAMGYHAPRTGPTARVSLARDFRIVGPSSSDANRRPPWQVLTCNPFLTPSSSDAARPDQDVVEFPLLLPLWQAMEIEATARRRGMTTGQMIRRLVGEMLGVAIRDCPGV